MQHLGTEEEMQQALLDIVPSLPPEKRLAGMSVEELLASLSPEMKEALRKQLQADAPPPRAE